MTGEGELPPASRSGERNDASDVRRSGGGRPLHEDGGAGRGRLHEVDVSVGAEPGGRSGDADRRHRSVLGVEHGSGDAHEADRRFLELERHPGLDYPVQLLTQQPGRGESARRAALQSLLDHPDEQFGRREGQQSLADRGAVQRQPATDPRGSGRLPVPTDLQDVDDLATVQHAEVYRLVRAFVEVLHEGGGDLQQSTFHGRAHAELEDLHAQPVSVIGPVEQADVHQVTDHPVQRALRQPGPALELGQAEAVVVGLEGEEDRDDLAEHRAQVRGRIAAARAAHRGHASIGSRPALGPIAPARTSRSRRGTTPRAASSRRAFRRVTTMPTTANSQTGYCTSQAMRNASAVKPPRALMTAPIAARTTRLARNPPRFTMLWASPRVGPGVDVRAMSKPTTEPGPPAESTTTSTTSSQRGAGPGSASTAVHTTKSAAMTPSTSQERRSGWRMVSSPTTGPMTMVETTKRDTSPPAAAEESPCAVTR